ncbi:MAG: hypothetical protein HKN93_09425 [Acidimicrobiia bacterium]|nr:hypothetical protein [Acidimicrobiia bacterium]
MRPTRPRFYRYQDIVADDDLTRMIHATDARADDIFHWQVCEDPTCACSGPGWSTKILAEVWHESLPAQPVEIAPKTGRVDLAEPGFINGSRRRR